MSGVKEDLHSDSTPSDTALKLPSPTENLIPIPKERLHDSGRAWSVVGIVIALVTALFGGCLLGAGYGAIIALNSERYLNLTVAFTFPFWMNLPSQFGFYLGHIQEKKWRYGIALIGFLTCYYSMAVGWVSTVLDGPGLTFSPIALAQYLFDSSLYSFWFLTYELKENASSFNTYLLVLRSVELIWIFQAGLLTCDTPSIYPYCRKCKKWMDNEAHLRFDYQPESIKVVRKLASSLVNQQFETLLELNKTVDPKQKGLDVKVFRCNVCKEHAVLDVVWFREKPDLEKSETEQLLESGTGTQLVKDLIVPVEIHDALFEVQEKQKQEESTKAKAA